MFKASLSCSLNSSTNFWYFGRELPARLTFDNFPNVEFLSKSSFFSKYVIAELKNDRTSSVVL